MLPPAVAGIALLAAFGNRGLLGGSLEAFGVSLPFTQAAVVVAIVFVSSPFYVRQAAAAFAAVDPRLLDASRTLGRRPGTNVPPSRAPARRRRARRGLVARLRARPRRIRSDDHLRGELPRRHPHRPARDLRRARPRLRRRRRARCAARRLQHRRPGRRNPPPLMDTLELSFSLPLRAFDLRLDLGVGAETLALVGPSGSGKSSALRAIAGLERASGRVVVGHERVARQRTRHRPPARATVRRARLPGLRALPAPHRCEERRLRRAGSCAPS